MQKSLYGLLFLCVVASVLLMQGYVAIAFLLVVGFCVCFVLLCAYEQEKLAKYLDNDTLLLPKTPLFFELAQKLSWHKQRNQNKIYTLQQNVSQLEKLVGAMPVGIMVLDKRASVVWTNTLAQTQFGVQTGESLTKIQDNLSADTDLWQTLGELPIYDRQFYSIELYQNELNQTQFYQKSSASQPILPKKNLWLNITLAPFYGTMTLLMSEDVSEKKQFFVSKTDFVANVSHELKTPLTVIQGFLETLQEYPELGIQERQQFLSLMQNESLRMSSLISDLLKLSHLENSQTVAHEPIHLSDICQKVLINTQKLAKTHNRPSDVLGEITQDIWVLGDENDLYSAISNIAFNAIWHTKTGDSVQIELTAQNQMATIAIKDTGDGIDSEHLPRLTERFYRVDKGRGRESIYQGSGLGLAIAKHALAQHNAQLRIDSQKGVGSCFWVDIATINTPS